MQTIKHNKRFEKAKYTNQKRFEYWTYGTYKAGKKENKEGNGRTKKEGENVQSLFSDVRSKRGDGGKDTKTNEFGSNGCKM